jgi:hypothetical protein
LGLSGRGGDSEAWPEGFLKWRDGGWVVGSWNDNQKDKGKGKGKGNGKGNSRFLRFAAE